jgi:hypothetical protein
LLLAKKFEHFGGDTIPSSQKKIRIELLPRFTRANLKGKKYVIGKGGGRRKGESCGSGHPT